MEAAINTAIDELVKKAETAPPKNDNPPKNEPAANAPPAVAAAFGKMLAESRTAKIQALVASHRITPAVATELQKEFCKPDMLSVSLSNGSTSPADGFDATITALSLQQPYVPTKEQTGAQVLELSNADVGDSAKNPLLKNAKRRAEQAAKR